MSTPLKQLTVKEYAAKERVSQRTVWTWIHKGAVTIRRTPGRGIRILVPSDRALSPPPGLK